MTSRKNNPWLLLVLALGVSAPAAAAMAADYVVVASTDPAVPRGQQVEVGQRLALAVGRTATLMHASGAIVMLKGSAAGVTAPPGRPANGAESERMAVLRLMVATSARPATLDRASRTRALCPPPEALVSLDGIVEAQKAGCSDAAVAALDAYVAKAAPQ